MGMYTEIALFVEFKPSTPKSVLDILERLTSFEDTVNFEGVELPDHPFFKCDRWPWLCIMGSAYFNGPTLAKFRIRKSDYDPCAELSFRSNLKNYSSEIEQFINWIAPYVKPDGFAGFTRYEEDDDPTLIYFEIDGVHLYSVSERNLQE